MYSKVRSYPIKDKSMKSFLFICLFLLISNSSWADLKVGDSAPIFKTKTHEGKDFEMNSRMGFWTVLYFYPKAETPGCTKQACGFRDNIEKIRAQGAEVFGISADAVEQQAAFHKNHQINFTLLADTQAQVIDLYGTKMPIVKMSKRWTFLIDPHLKIRWFWKDVDPVLDAQKVALKLKELKEIDNRPVKFHPSKELLPNLR